LSTSDSSHEEPNSRPDVKEARSVDTDVLAASINDAINKISSIPFFKVENVSSDELKDSLIPILDRAKKRVSDIEYINQGLDSVRGEIIEPVNKIIKDSSKPSIAIGKWGLWLGGFGILISAYAIISGQIIPSIEQPRAPLVKNNNVQTDVNISGGSGKIRELKDILQGGEFSYSSSLYEKVVELTNSIENLLERHELSDLVKIQQYENKLISLLGEIDRNDGALLLQVIYCSALLNSEKLKWDKLLVLSDYIERNSLPKSGYYFSFLVYKAEAYFRLGNIDAALSIYNDLVLSGDDYTYASSLFPDSRKKESVKNIAAARLKKISVDRALETSKIVLVNSSAMKIKGLAAKERMRLIEQGFRKDSIFTETDENKVSKVYGYYRNQENLWLLKKIVKILYPKAPKNILDFTKHDKSTNKMVKKLFLDESVGVLIRMPNPI